MNKWLLSILLASWSLVITSAELCDTGTAKSGEVLSVQRSLLANADVALLTGYNASSLSVCLEECCTAKYGACSVAVFKKSNTTESTCIHYNCRPILKCKFLRTDKYDSFIFPALSAQHTSITTTTTTSVPSTSSISTLAVTDSDQTNFSVTREEIATFSEEELDLKNDNTTVKPRKGVEENVVILSGSKPRKGAVFPSLDLQPSEGMASHSTVPTSSASSSAIYDIKPTRTVDQFVSSAVMDNESQTDNLLEMIFEDDPSENLSTSHEGLIASHSTSTTLSSVSSTEQNDFSSTVPATSSDFSTSELKPSSVLHLHTDFTLTPSLDYTEVSTLHLYTDTTLTPSLVHSEGSLLPSSDTTTLTSSDSPTPEHKAYTTSNHLESSFLLSTSTVPRMLLQTSSVYSGSSKVLDTDVPSPTIPELLNAKAQSYQVTNKDDEELEKERKYQSSMHLVLSLVFGLLVLFAVIGVVARRVYDGWMRRHYRRMDFLIDGMYNGYE